MKADLFQSCGHCWIFLICWHIECSTFTASSFRIWKSSTGIPSAPLALFIVMLPKAHLTLHSRMSGSRWVITLSWLSGSWRSFLYSSSVYSCHLFLISSASVRSIPFLSFQNDKGNNSPEVQNKFKHYTLKMEILNAWSKNSQNCEENYKNSKSWLEIWVPLPQQLIEQCLCLGCHDKVSVAAAV